MKLHMRSDVEVGRSLSGGLDSSAIASVIGKDYAGVPFRTFTIYYKGKGQMDERAWVREVTAAYPNIDPVYCSPCDDELAACFDHVISSNDLPLHSSSAISYYFIMKVAAQNGMKVMLDGQGSDEYLAGYLPSFDRLIGGYLRKLRVVSALETLRCYASRRGLGRRGMPQRGFSSEFQGEGQWKLVSNLNGVRSLGFAAGFDFILRNFGGLD